MQRADDVGERGLDGQRNLGGPVGRAQNLHGGRRCAGTGSISVRASVVTSMERRVWQARLTRAVGRRTAGGFRRFGIAPIFFFFFFLRETQSMTDWRNEVNTWWAAPAAAAARRAAHGRHLGDARFAAHRGDGGLAEQRGHSATGRPGRSRLLRQVMSGCARRPAGRGRARPGRATGGPAAREVAALNRAPGQRSGLPGTATSPKPAPQPGTAAPRCARCPRLTSRCSAGCASRRHAERDESGTTGCPRTAISTAVPCWPSPAWGCGTRCRPWGCSRIPRTGDAAWPGRWSPPPTPGWTAGRGPVPGLAGQRGLDRGGRAHRVRALLRRPGHRQLERRSPQPADGVPAARVEPQAR